MQGSTLAAVAVGTVLGVFATLVTDHLRWRRERSERDRDALRAAFTDYLTALSQARAAFSRAEPSLGRVGEGHVVISEYGVYTAQHRLELVARGALVDRARGATLSVLDLYDVVVAGHLPDSGEYLRAWQAARRTRTALVGEMRRAL
ncbi:hypothetical protein [Streptomyces sp. NPDC005438]|uniref:hypothetical protein n=1 Tax=Streptomyces sp. NPDC005438 TaxID=3156880 RepID=UPI0033B3DC40